MLKLCVGLVGMFGAFLWFMILDAVAYTLTGFSFVRLFF